MNHRVVAGLLCMVSVVAIGLGYLLLHPVIIGWCSPEIDVNCLGESIAFGIGSPFYWSIRWLPFFFFALIFVRKDIFQSWWKFGVLFAILPLLLIVVSPPIGEMFTPDRTLITERMVQLFVIASALFIGWKYWHLRKS